MAVNLKMKGEILFNYLFIEKNSLFDLVFNLNIAKKVYFQWPMLEEIRMVNEIDVFFLENK